MKIFYVDVLPEFKPFLTMHIIKSDSKFALVDPGPLRAVENVLDGLRFFGIELDSVKYILLTHIHIDHAGGVGELLRYLPEAKVVMHEKGVKHMIDPSYLWEKTLEVLGDLAKRYGEIKPIPKERIIVGKDNQVLDLGNLEIRVIETPGHASHHLAYFVEENKGIFTGDSAGVYIETWDVLWPTAPPPFNLEKALNSLQKLLDLEPRFSYLPHYGTNKNAKLHIETYISMLKLFEKTIQENIDAPPEKIIDIIARKDENIRKAYPLIQHHPIWSGGIRRSIEGIRSYILWKQKQSA